MLCRLLIILPSNAKLRSRNADGDGHRKRKRSLVRKSSVILSSGSDSESLDDSEESSFEAGESSSSEADDDVEDLLDSDEEAGPMSEEQSKVGNARSFLRRKEFPGLTARTILHAYQSVAFLAQ